MKILYCVEFSYYWYTEDWNTIVKIYSQVFEKVLVQNILFGLSPGFTNSLQLIPRWRFVVATMPHVMHCVAAMLQHRWETECWIIPRYIIYDFNRIQEKLLYLKITGKNLVLILELQKQSYFIPFTGYCQMPQMSAVFKPRKKESWIYLHFHTYFHFRQ